MRFIIYIIISEKAAFDLWKTDGDIIKDLK